MTSSSFHTENLDFACQWVERGPGGAKYALLDVLGQTRHQVLAVLVQAVGLFLKLVGGVDDGDMETALSASLGVLNQLSISRVATGREWDWRRPTLMLGKSETSAASSFWRRAETEKALVVGGTLREAMRRERVADCRRAMVDVEVE